jgi:hypothetical protein
MGWQGLRIEAGNCIVTGNKILDSGGSGSTIGLRQYSGANNIWSNNRVIGCDTAASFVAGTGRVYDNVGYNPKGLIANPVSGAYLVDSGSGTIANYTTYTCDQSDKTLYITGGTIITIEVNGVTVYTSTEKTIYLNAAQTVRITWSSAPTITCMGV